MTGIPSDDVRYQSLRDLDPAVAEAMAGEFSVKPISERQ